MVNKGSLLVVNYLWLIDSNDRCFTIAFPYHESVVNSAKLLVVTMIFGHFKGCLVLQNRCGFHPKMIIASGMFGGTLDLRGTIIHEKLQGQRQP